MKKNEVIEKSKKAMGIFVRIKRVFQIVNTVGLGILSGIAIFRELYSISFNVGYSLYFALVVGMLISAVILFILKCLWICIAKLKHYGTILWKNYQIRKYMEDEHQK